MSNDTNVPAVSGLCADCPFWDHIEGTTTGGDVVAPMTAGICRRSNPHHVQDLVPESVPATMVSGIRPGIWPVTRASDWCGIHPLRAAAYDLGVETMRGKIRDAERARRRGTPPTGGSSGSKR